MISTQMVDRIVTAYMISPRYLPLFRSNSTPAKSPLSAKNSLGHWPISMVPAACANVTALSSVAKIQVIRTTVTSNATPASRGFLHDIRSAATPSCAFFTDTVSPSSAFCLLWYPGSAFCAIPTVSTHSITKLPARKIPSTVSPHNRL